MPAVDLYTSAGRHLRYWGSECTDCGSATPGSQRCDQCQSTQKTHALYQLVPELEPS